MYKTAIETALKNANSDGFTTALKGTTKRFVIAFTNNDSNPSIDKLNWQATALSYDNSNINIGGRIDSKTNKKYIDISTSVNDLNHALNIAKFNKQIAIWDNVEFKEIRI